MNTKPVSYLQTDTHWANISYSAPGESTTIGKAGCGPTAAAMVVATLSDLTITPKEAAAWSLTNGYKALKQGTYYSFFTAYGRKHGLVWQQLNGSNLRNLSASAAKPHHDKAAQAVRDGHMVIACMGPGNWTSSGHYILWWGLEGSTVYINDSASTKAARLKNTLALLQSEVKYYFVCYTPVTSKNEEEADMTDQEIRAIVSNEIQRLKEEELAKVDNMPDTYAKEAIDKAIALGVLNGDSKGNLRLHSGISRQDYFVVLDRLGVLE